MTLTAVPDAWRRMSVRELERDGLLLRDPDGRWFLTRRAQASLLRLEPGEWVDQFGQRGGTLTPTRDGT